MPNWKEGPYRDYIALTKRLGAFHWEQLTANLGVASRGEVYAIYVAAKIPGNSGGLIANILRLVFPLTDATSAEEISSFYGKYVHVAFFEGTRNTPFLVLVAKPRNAKKLRAQVTRALALLMGGVTKTRDLRQSVRFALDKAGLRV